MEDLTYDQLGKRLEQRIEELEGAMGYAEEDHGHDDFEEIRVAVEDLQGTIRILVTGRLVERGHASSWAEAADIPMARAVELLQSDLEKYG